MGGLMFILRSIAVIADLIVAKIIFYAKWIITGIVVVCLGTCVVIGRPSDIQEYGPSDTDMLTAYNYAEGFVKERLKSPSSATFPETQRRINDTKYIGVGEYRIASYVESYNSFGVMIRADFKCTITLKDGKATCSGLEIE